MRRLTLSLPDDLLDETDSVARRLRQTRSGLVQTVLRDFLDRQRRRKLETLMAEGYQEMAEESTRNCRKFSVVEDQALAAAVGGADDGLDW